MFIHQILCKTQPKKEESFIFQKEIYLFMILILNLILEQKEELFTQLLMLTSNFMIVISKRTWLFYILLLQYKNLKSIRLMN